MSDVKKLYQHLCATECPVLAQSVGDFLLYESLLAGYADRFVRGELLGESSVPTPDDKTVSCVRQLRAKTNRSQEENYFLEYFDMLEKIRSLLVEQGSKGSE